MTPEEKDLMAAEYVIGTLPLPERRVFEQAMQRNPALAALVRAWEDRFAALDRVTPPVAPSPHVWGRVSADLGLADAVEAPTLADVAGWETVVVPLSPEPQGEDLGTLSREDEVDPDRPSAEILTLERRVGRWRTLAAIAGAMAAGLAALVVNDRLMPPASLPEAGRYVAVVNTDGSQPALLVSVDTAAGTVTVRSVAAEQPEGRSLELWHIADGGKPVSLGVLDPAAPVLRISADRAGPSPGTGTIAVTVEPPGGSGDKGPTGPVVYSGKLIPELP